MMVVYHNNSPNRPHKAYITFYGYPDNDPPNSAAIGCPRSEGYSTLHNTAGGIGTWKDPITFAAGTKFRAVYKVGTRIYVPYLQIYCILEDQCASCNALWWVDIWIGGQGYTSAQTIAQEENLTRDSATIVLNPSEPALPRPGETAAQVRRVERTPLMRR